MAPWVLAIAIVLGLLGGAVYLLYLGGGQLLVWFAKLDKLVQAAFIAVGGAVATAVTALIVKQVKNRHTVDAQFRKDKADLFLDFMKAFDDMLSPDKHKKIKRGDNLVNLLADFRRKTVFWCSVRTMKKPDELKVLRGFEWQHGTNGTWTRDVAQALR